MTLTIHQTITLGATTPPPPPMQFWRVKHWAEIGINMTNRPEVIVFDGNSTNFTEGWQWVSYWTCTTINPLVTVGITKEKWRVVHDAGRWGHNKTGFNRSGDPRRDYVTPKDLTAPLPKWDKTRGMGGMIVTGVEDGGNLIITAANQAWKTPPTLAQMPEFLKQFWLYFDLVNVGGSINELGRFPQNSGQRIFSPLIASSSPIMYPLSKLQKLPASFDFKTYDPYKLSYP